MQGVVFEYEYGGPYELWTNKTVFNIARTQNNDWYANNALKGTKCMHTTAYEVNWLNAIKKL